MRKSRAIILPAKPTPAPGVPVPVRNSGRSTAHPQPAPTVDKKPFPIGPAIAGGGVVMLIAGIVLIATNSSGTSSGNVGDKPRNSNVALNTNQAPAKTDQPGSLKKPDEGSSDPAPMVRNPNAPKTDSQPTTQPDATQATIAKPVATTPEAEQQAFKNDLAAAEKLSNSEKYSAALEILSRLKTTYEKTAWWPDQKQAVQGSEKKIQERAAELAAEADDVRAKLAKCDKPDVLDKFEAQWAPRAVGTQSGDGWTLLEPVKLESAGGTVLTKQADGSVFATGPEPEDETFTVTVQTSLNGITALRVDALADPTLENGGPGRHSNFVLTEISVQAGPVNGALAPVALVKPSVDFCQNNEALIAVAFLLDGNQGTGWGIGGEYNKSHCAVFELAAPLAEAGRIVFKLDFRSQWKRLTIGRTRFSATTAKVPQNASQAVSNVPQTQPLSDPLVAQPARAVLKTIAESRARIAEQNKQKRIADIMSRLDAVERQIKARPRQVAPVYKALDEIDALISMDTDVVEKFGERSGQARFDAASIKDGDLSIYRAPTKTVGGGAEVNFDFSSPDEYGVWFFDNPGNSGGCELDLKKGAVVMKSAARHNWDGKDRRDCPVLKLPFYFKGDNWVVEANVSLLSDQNKTVKPDFGVLVWDGTTNVGRLSVQDAGAKGLYAHFGSSTPKRENFWTRPATFAGKIKENVRLQISCSGGTVVCTATSSSGGSVTLPKEPLGFEPQFVGLFLRNADDAENSSVLFQSVKVQGVPNAERLKELRETRRSVAAATMKTELLKRNAALKSLNEGQFVPLPLEKVATISSGKRMFNGATDDERLILPNWGLLMAQGVPFMVADPKGDTVNNVIVLNSAQGKVSSTMPQSVTLPVNGPATAIHLLSGVSGWGFPGGEARSLSMTIRIQYEDNMIEEHKLLNGVHFADVAKPMEVPDSKSALLIGQQQLRYIVMKVARPTTTIKTIEFIKGDDKTAPIIAGVTLDRRGGLTSLPFSNTGAKLILDGKVGKGFVCLGQQWVDIPHTAELDPAQLTVEAWIYLEQYPTGDARRWIVNKNTHEGVQGHYALMINGMNVGAYMNIGETFDLWSAGGLQLKQWQHIAMTYDGKDLKIFLNGNQVGAKPINRARVPGGTPVAIGRRQDSYAAFTGIIDEVRIYSRALPDDELKAHFNKPGEASKEGLSGYWGFE